MLRFIFAFSLLFFAFTQPSFAARQCTELFANPHFTFTTDVLNHSLHFWYTPSQYDGKHASVSWYQTKLQTFLSTAQSTEQLIQIFYTIENLGKVDHHFQHALRTTDLLQSLRTRNVSDFSSDQLSNFKDALKGLVKRNHTSGWAPTLDAYLIWENPIHGNSVINSWLNHRLELRSDYLYTGQFLNLTLIQSLANMPSLNRTELLAKLQDEIIQIDGQIKQNELNEDQTKALKESIRQFQFVQQILLRIDFARAIYRLPKVVRSENFAEVEQVLQRLHRHNNPYSFQTVFSAAKTIQQQMGSVFNSSDYVDMFGSFPNLAANLQTSDIDVLFSYRIDQLCYDLVTRTQGAVRLSTEILKTTEEVHFANFLLNTHTMLKQLPELQSAQGNLFSVSLQERELMGAEMVISGSLESAETWFSMTSPLMIRIYKNRIVLRAWDSFSAYENATAHVYEFELSL